MLITFLGVKYTFPSVPNPTPTPLPPQSAYCCRRQKQNTTEYQTAGGNPSSELRVLGQAGGYEG